jgi:hypothetical protein
VYRSAWPKFWATIFLGIGQVLILTNTGWARAGGLGLGLLLPNPKARARVGLVFGLSPHARPQARPPDQAPSPPPRPGQARKKPSPQCKARAQPKPALFRPAPALGWATFWAIFFINSSGHPGLYNSCSCFSSIPRHVNQSVT